MKRKDLLAVSIRFSINIVSADPIRSADVPLFHYAVVPKELGLVERFARGYRDYVSEGTWAYFFCV